MYESHFGFTGSPFQLNPDPAFYFESRGHGNALAYRIRPYYNDPERCRFEVWSLTTWPESYPETRATLKGRFDKDDKQNWPLIPIQDFSNIERQQKGLHVLGYQGHRLGHPVVWEVPYAEFALAREG